MMQTATNKTDAALKNDVLSELKYEPSVMVSDIGVLVKDGVVTLNGSTSSYGEKRDAVCATKRVAGVKAIADDIEVKLPGTLHRNDSDIASAAAQQIEWSSTIPTKSVNVIVRDGMITLEGNVEWWYQKNAAENAVHHLSGIRGILNNITIKPHINPTGVEVAIEAAFKRSAVLDAKKIQIETSGNKVTLRGEVRNYAEEEEAERAAWAAPGVLTVDNQLTVNWFGYAS